MRIIRLQILTLLALCSCHSKADEPSVASPRDLYSDTWVANDALDREMPSYSQVGDIKKDKARTVGIFYITWHANTKRTKDRPYTADVEDILAQYPEARLDGHHPAWQQGYHHWAEPEMGYFLSTDQWMIRRDMSMLSDAGVDVIIMDATNAVLYWDEWEATFSTMQQMADEGNKVPQFCFWAFNGPVISVVQQIYEGIYKTEKYKDLWFHWQGKPLFLWNDSPLQDATQNKGNKNINHHYDSLALTDENHPHYGDNDYTQKYYTDYTQEVKDFFSTRMMWWGYAQWKGKPFVGTEGNWSFGYDLGHPQVKNLPVDRLASHYKGEVEQMAVTPAQHSFSHIGKSWTREHGEPQLDEQDMPVSAYVPWLGKEVSNPAGYGIYFQERWNEALEADPAFLYINDWNEWTAIKFRPDQLAIKVEDGKAKFMKRQSNFVFVDQYNAEFNRGIQPMKGGYTDNYYMQMAQNIRRYKGVRPIPVHHTATPITIDGKFKDWSDITIEYRDTKGDTKHRDHQGYGDYWYTDTSGRNDIITAKVGLDEDLITFYAQTTAPLTHHTDDDWMVLLIDADQNANTGWQGYDFMVKDYATKAQLHSYENGQWTKHGELDYAYNTNELELAISRSALNINGDTVSFDFKWTDHPKNLDDITSLFNHGDTAPNRRFNYRYIFQQQ